MCTGFLGLLFFAIYLQWIETHDPMWKSAGGDVMGLPPKSTKFFVETSQHFILWMGQRNLAPVGRWFIPMIFDIIHRYSEYFSDIYSQSYPLFNSDLSLSSFF